jgi:hypothetical protein
MYGTAAEQKTLHRAGKYLVPGACFFAPSIAALRRGKLIP